MLNKPLQLPEDIQRILLRVRDEIVRLDWVDKIILFGSYAKGCYDQNSDLDIAVFVKKGYCCHLEEYRQLARICRTAQLDIQVQAFSSSELEEPCGIVDEIVEFGIDITQS